MDIAYFILVLLGFSGILTGAIIARLATEELKTGKKFFIILKFILASVLIYYGIIHFRFHPKLLLIPLSSIVLFKYEKNADVFLYPLFAGIFWTASNSPDFALVTSLIFLYGLPSGSLFIYYRKFKKFFPNYIPYLALCIILYF